MYDEDQLMRDTMEAIRNGVKVFGQINNMVKENKEKKEMIKESLLHIDDDKFVFTGNVTDLRYFTENNSMSVDMIENIADEKIKNAVKDEFNHAILSKKIEINPRSGRIVITDKGRKFINKSEFKKAVAFELNKLQKDKSQTMGFELEGTSSDLNYFRYKDTLDLNDVISNPDTDTVQKILSNFDEMRKAELIEVDKSIVKISEKGKKILDSPLFQAAQNNFEKAASMAGTPGKIFVVTKNLASAVFSNHHMKR